MTFIISKNKSGMYSGNNTVNRAIAHGLGVTPKAVFISRGGGWFYRLIPGTGVLDMLSSTTSQNLAITTMDSTNFYVGNASGYSYTANDTGATLRWVAIP